MTLQALFVLLPFIILFVNNFCCFGHLDSSISDWLDDNSIHGTNAYPSHYITNVKSAEFALKAKSSMMTVNVEDYGAKGDGNDDSQAFKEAWNQVCSSSTSATLLVPHKNTYLLKPVTFSGPCKSNVTVEIKGTMAASSDPTDWNGKNPRYWIIFDGVENLALEGGGTINGNGKIWWEKSCKIDETQPCKDAPTALTLYNCKSSSIQNLVIQNSQQIHVSFEGCTNVIASNLVITAPEKSPNTDGIHVTGTQNIQIINCVIGTGDDCISIVSGSRNVKASGINCGPGHGISIGSLGADNSEASVSDVTIDTAQLNGTTNGVRIKTWQGGSGYAKNIKFKNIDMHNVQNPIIIDQNYCDSTEPCNKQKSAVEVSNVLYQNIKGTSASEIAISFNCSQNVPCQGIVLENIDITTEDKGTTKSSCENVQWKKIGNVIPAPCSTQS